jgi:hypothetical protein
VTAKNKKTMHRINITLTEWDKDMLEELSYHYGVSHSDMIRRLILLAHTNIMSQRGTTEE